MAAEPIAGAEPPLPSDAPDELFDAVGPDRSDEDFWAEADRSHTPHRRRAPRHRARTGLLASAGARVSTAWAAERSARRALRTRPTSGASDPGRHRRRKVGAAIFGASVVLALLAAGADIGRTGTSPTTEEAAGAMASSGPDVDGSTGSGADRSDDVMSVTTEATRRDGTSSRTASTTAPKAASKARPGSTGGRPANDTSASGAAGTTGSAGTPPSAGAPSTATPATPVATTRPPSTPVATTVAPTPTAPPATPTTTAPRPQAKPTVQSFSATPATLPGGPCAPTQWATRLSWSTANATSVTITALLEPAFRNLPVDGSFVACRALPGAPVGGWTLTAAGAGGSTTAAA